MENKKKSKNKKEKIKNKKNQKRKNPKNPKKIKSKNSRKKKKKKGKIKNEEGKLQRMRNHALELKDFWTKLMSWVLALFLILRNMQREAAVDT